MSADDAYLKRLERMALENRIGYRCDVCLQIWDIADMAVYARYRRPLNMCHDCARWSNPNGSTRWTDYSTIDAREFASLPERYHLVARWTRHFPIESVLTFTYYYVMTIARNEPQHLFEGNYHIITYDRRGCPNAAIHHELYRDTFNYAIRLRRGDVFGVEVPTPSERLNELVFRAPGRTGVDRDITAFLDQMLVHRR